jgi:hypothetical protein
LAIKIRIFNKALLDASFNPIDRAFTAKTKILENESKNHPNMKVFSNEK